MNDEAWIPQGDGPHFIGSNMREIEDDIRLYAKRRKSILLIGEPGTGKDLAATIAADATGLEIQPIMLSTLKGELAYSDLFGHEKGAFTGATERKIGLLEQSANKLCFINELGTSDDIQIQKGLLRFLEKKELKRRGGEDRNVITVDTYIIGACQSTESLGADVLRRFERKIELPPLVWRARRVNRYFVSDIMDIAKEHLLKKDVVLIKEDFVKRILLMHNYPGNVGDLINFLDTECDIAEHYWEKANTYVNSPYGISVLFFSNYDDLKNVLAKVRNADSRRFREYLRRSGLKGLFAVSKMRDDVDTMKDGSKNNIYTRRMIDMFNKAIKLKNLPPERRKEILEIIDNHEKGYPLPAYVRQLIPLYYYDFDSTSGKWMPLINLSKWQPILIDMPNLPDHIGNDFNSKWRELLKHDIAKGVIKENPYFYAIRQEYACQPGKGEDTVIKSLMNSLPEDWLSMPLQEIEKRVIKIRYEHYGENQTKTARSLGIDRTTLNRKLKEFGLR
jgi:transcriptional regulator with AAA-type ATPase domain